MGFAFFSYSRGHKKCNGRGTGSAFSRENEGKLTVSGKLTLFDTDNSAVACAACADETPFSGGDEATTGNMLGCVRRLTVMLKYRNENRKMR